MGVYTYDRRSKDLGGTVPAHVHADTTFVADLTPVTPGADLRQAPTSILVRISHHGPEPVEGQIGPAPACPSSRRCPTAGSS